MLKNYFKVAWRNLMKKKLFSFINITGLALGLAFAALIGLYIYNNISVDKDQPANLYRVITTYTSDTKNDQLNTVGRALVPAIEQNVPEVEKVIPVKSLNGVAVKMANQYYFDKIVFAGKDFLTSFNYPLLEGNSRNALDDPFSLVLTEETAKKYFGRKDVIGETLVIADSVPFKVTGVLKGLPPSHMNFDILLSISSWEKWGGNMQQWFVWDMTCYVQLKSGVNKERATEKISALSMQLNGKEYGNFGYNVKHRLEAVKDIYLQSSLAGFNKPKGSKSQLYILTAIGIALLSLACINFINLTTAYQSERTLEVGIRKTMGAKNLSLITQFMIETFTLILISTILAVVLIFLLLPLVEKITNQSIPLALLASPTVIFGGLTLIICTTLLAGWYPSLLLSKLNPTGTIKKNLGNLVGGFTLRKSLVVFQFAVSLVLIIGTIIAARQFNYIQNKDLGFTKDPTIVINLRNAPYQDIQRNYESIKHELSKLPNTKSVAGSAGLPGKYGWDGQIVQPEGYDKNKSVTLEVIPSDKDYVKTLSITILEGRDFSDAFATDSKKGVLLNEAACQLIGWQPKEAIGKIVSTSGMDSGRVLGVMRNYHQHGLQEKVNPIMIFNASYAYQYLAVRVGSGNLTSSIQQLEAFWTKRFPGYTLNYTLLEDELSKQYAEEIKLARVINVFSLLTIFIAALGLFGLVTFTTTQRTKEIGIRKVLGAPISNIAFLIAKQFLFLVAIAIALSVPIAWWMGEKWLQNFAYRTSIEWWVFIAAAITAILITLLTISYHSIKAAMQNPVKSLRA